MVRENSVLLSQWSVQNDQYKPSKFKIIFPLDLPAARSMTRTAVYFSRHEAASEVARDALKEVRKAARDGLHGGARWPQRSVKGGTRQPQRRCVAASTAARDGLKKV